MSAFAWRRQSGRPSSPPESSVAGRRSGPDTSDSFDPAFAHRGMIARAGSAVRRLRPVLAAVLLSLPLLGGLTIEAAAQNVTISIGTPDDSVDPHIEGSGTASARDVRRPSRQLSDIRFKVCFTSSSATPDFAVKQERFVNRTIIVALTLDQQGCVTNGSRRIATNALASDTFLISRSANNSVDEPDEVITMTISNDPNAPPPTGVAQINDSDTITIRDDDPTVVTLSRVGSDGVTEGGTVEFTVSLGRALVAGETIDVPLDIGGTRVTTSDWSLATESGTGLNTGVTLSGTNTATPTVRFSGAGAETATLVLTAMNDGAMEGTETFTIALGNNAAFDATSLGTNVGGGADPSGTANSFNVVVTDLVTGSFVFDPTSVTVVEGESKTYTVALDTRPTGTVTVALSRSGDSDVTFSPATLTFNASGTKLWSEPQTVTVNAAMDPDGTPDTATIRHSASGGGYYGVSGNVGVTVIDNDVASLALSTSSLSVTEGKSETYRVRLSVEPTGPVTVTLSSNNGDVTFSPASLTFNASGTNLWSDPQTVTVSASQDVDRSDETATIAHTASGGGYGSVSGTVSVAVLDDDASSCTNCVWITAGSSGGVTEGEKARFLLRANPAPSRDLRVEVQVLDKRGGSAAHRFLRGWDTRVRTLIIPAGRNVVVFEVQTQDDRTDEPDASISAHVFELVTAGGNVDRNSGYYAHREYAWVRVRDNDDPPPPETVRPEVSFAQAVSFVEEGDSISLTVNLVPAPASQITLGYRVVGNARAGSDYTRLSGTVSVPAGTSAVSIEVQTTDDGSHEGSEDLVLRLSKGAGYRVKKGETALHSVYIEDNDGGGTFSGTPVVFFGSMSSTVVENSGRAATRFTVTPAPTSQLTVNLAMSGGSATAGSDYTNLTSIAVPAGQSVVVIDNILDDSVTEGDESFTIELQAGTGYRVYDPGTGSNLRRNRHTVNIVDDETDRAKIVSHTLSQTTIEEDAADPWVDVDVRLSEEHSPAVPGVLGLPLDFSVCFSGSARRSNSMSKTGANGYDYRVWLGDRILTTACPSGRFEPGETQVRMRIEILDDSHEDSGETIRVGMLRDDVERWRRFGVLLRAPLQTLIVLNDETTTLLAGHPLVKYRSLVKSFYDRITANHQHGDSADGGWNKRFLKAMGHPEYVDYPQAAVTVADATRLWNHGGPGANTAWDGTVEAVTYAEQYFAGQTTTPDPASGPEVTIAAGDGVTEGTAATFTLTADPAPAAPLDVSVTVATDGDYGITAGTQTVTIPTSGSATLTLATAGDEADETDGSVSVTVDAGTGYTVGAASSGTIAIADDDDPAPETGTAHPAVDPALIAQIREWMAAPGGNVAVRNERFTRVLAAFGVESHANPMTVAEAEGYVRNGWGARWQRIVDALKAIEAYVPPASGPEVTIAAGSGVTEGASATFTLTADPAPAAPLDVTVTVATDGDYGIAAGSRTVTIPTAGSATLTLATTGDDVDEADGSVTVTVDAGTGYTVGSASSGTVAIADDDASATPDPEVTIAAGSGVTEGTAATFTLTADPAPSAPLDVTVTVATDGDYGIAAGERTVTIPTAGSATLTLATAGDEADEPDGSVTVTVDAGTGYTIGAASSGTVAIVDDDLPPPAISVTAGAGVTEGGDAVFTVKADRAPAADLAVTLTVSEKASSDFVAAADEGAKTVTVLASQTEATLTVKTDDDAVDEPDGSVTATVDAGTGYTVAPSPANAASVAVADNDAAAGPPTISVEDVTVQEGGTAVIPVRLSPAPTKPVRLFYKTMGAPVGSEGYASWADFKSARAWLNFRPGETLKHARVRTVQDSHDDGGEWFEVFVIPAQGHAVPAAGVYATVTIENDDPMPGAYLARFGRTVAEQALEGISGRMAADRTPGMRGTVAGQALNFDPAASGHPAAGATPGVTGASGTTMPGPVDRQAALAMADIARGLGADASAPAGPGSAFPGSLSVASGAGPGGAADRFGVGHGWGNAHGLSQSRTMTARDALLGSSFSLTGQRDGAGGSLAFWGRASQGSFDGAERGDGTDIRLDGTVTTGMLGTDYARGSWLIGLALTQSSSEGSYAAIGGEGDGDVEASLTAAIPYAALRASERLKLWGAAGYGTGEVTLKTAPGSGSGAGSGERLSADTRWTMAAAGVRGDLLTPPDDGGGPALALTSDALWARTSSEKTGELAATESDVTRLRLGLEGSYRIAMEGDSHLTPKLEIGARHDGGDAETGFGVEVGGGIAWVDPSLGLSLDVSGRTLLAHENDDLKDRGFSAALGFDPAPATQRGPSLSLRQDFGGQAQGGLDALFVNDPLEDRAGSEATSRWALEAAYGLPVFGDRFTGSPHVGFGLSTGARDYSLGWRLTPEAATAPDLSFGVKATRRESDTAEAEHTVGFEAVARW